MNNDPIEERLQRLQPTPLPNDLMARLIAARPQPQPVKRASWLPRWVWFGGPAVALGLLIAGAFIGGGKRTKTPPEPANLLATAPASQLTRILLPAEQRNILVRAEDLGIVAADTPHPVRLVRTIWLDDATFRSTDGGSRARLTQPRERIIPVSLEIY